MGPDRGCVGAGHMRQEMSRVFHLIVQFKLLNSRKFAATAKIAQI